MSSMYYYIEPGSGSSDLNIKRTADILDIPMSATVVNESDYDSLFNFEKTGTLCSVDVISPVASGRYYINRMYSTKDRLALIDANQLDNRIKDKFYSKESFVLDRHTSEKLSINMVNVDQFIAKANMESLSDATHCAYQNSWQRSSQSDTKTVNQQIAEIVGTIDFDRIADILWDQFTLLSPKLIEVCKIKGQYFRDQISAMYKEISNGIDEGTYRSSFSNAFRITTAENTVAILYYTYRRGYNNSTVPFMLSNGEFNFTLITETDIQGRRESLAEKATKRIHNSICNLIEKEIKEIGNSVSMTSTNDIDALNISPHIVLRPINRKKETMVMFIKYLHEHKFFNLRSAINAKLNNPDSICSILSFSDTNEPISLALLSSAVHAKQYLERVYYNDSYTESLLNKVINEGVDQNEFIKTAFGQIPKEKTTRRYFIREIFKIIRKNLYLVAKAKRKHK